MKFFIAVFFLMVLTACAVQTEEIEKSVQEIVSTAIYLPIIPTAQSDYLYKYMMSELAV